RSRGRSLSPCESPPPPAATPFPYTPLFRSLADAVAREIARVERDFAPTNAALATLSADELTIARLVHQGATNKEVAGALYLSVRDRKSTRLNSSHVKNSYAVFCLKTKKC